MAQVSKEKTLPDPFEWDFRDIDDETELYFATLYEYARTSKFKPVLENWFNTPIWNGATVPELRHHDQICRKYRINRSTTCTIRDAIELVHNLKEDVFSKAHAIGILFQDTPAVLHKSYLLSIAVRFPDFPEPWMKIRLLKEDQYLKARCFDWPRNTPALRDLYDPFQEDPLYSLYTEARPANLECFTFEIDWTASPEEIRQAFASWLSKRHPARPGKRDPGLQLRCLSTYRLRQAGFSDTRAQSEVSRYRKFQNKTDKFACLPSYISQKKMGRSRSACRKFVRARGSR